VACHAAPAQEGAESREELMDVVAKKVQTVN